MVELASTHTGLTDGLAAESLRYRPGHALPVVRALIGGRDVDDEVGGVAPEALRAARELLEQGPLTVIVGRANLAESGRSIAAAASAIHHTLPDVRFLSALRRANVHGALELGLAPGLLPGRVTLDAGRDWFADRWPELPEAKGLDTAGILRAAADGKVDTLVLLGADPLADFPDRDLAERGPRRGPHGRSPSTSSSPSRSKQAEVVLPVAGYAEVSGTTTNLEGRVSGVTQKVTPPGTAQSDWIVAAELAARLGFDLGVESVPQLAAEIEAVAPAFAGLTADLLASVDARDGVVVMLPTRRSGNGDSAMRRRRADEGAAEVPVVTAGDAARRGRGRARRRARRRRHRGRSRGRPHRPGRGGGRERRGHDARARGHPPAAADRRGAAARVDDHRPAVGRRLLAAARRDPQALRPGHARAQLAVAGRAGRPGDAAPAPRPTSTGSASAPATTCASPRPRAT